MLKRQIAGIIGIGLWAGLVTAAVIWSFKSRSRSVDPLEKAPQESGVEANVPIETLAKDLVSALADDDYIKAAENFNGTMKKALPAEKLQQVWNSLNVKFGDFVEQLGTRKEKVLQYDVIFVTCKFEKGILDTKVVFNNKKQVAGLFFIPSQGTSK